MKPLIGILILFFAPLAHAEFLQESSVSWKVNEFDVSRWKTLVGGNEGGQIDRDDIQFGLWQLAPKATYHGHKHSAPEIYYILSGEALWTVGETTKRVTSGMTIYTKPGEMHRMVNESDQPVEAIWVWWAPDGDTDVFTAPYLFTEPAPPQPNGLGFGETAGEKIR